MISKKEVENMILDLKMDEARAVAEKEGLCIRAIKRDGKHLIHTEDINPFRVNVEVAYGKVVKVFGLS